MCILELFYLIELIWDCKMLLLLIGIFGYYILALEPYILIHINYE